MITAAQTQTLVDQVSKTRLIATINTLSAFLTRYSAYTNAQAVADSVQSMFAASGLTGITQEKWLDYDFTGEPESYYGTGDMIHVIATITGTLFPDKYIIVSAHHDSYSYSSINDGDSAPAPGADDNASGVAALVEMAKLIIDSGFQPLISIRFISFGGEEFGLLGSMEYIADHLTDDVVLDLNMDMIGYAANPTDEATIKLHPYDTDNNVNDSGYSFFDQASVIIPTYTNIKNITTGIMNAFCSDSYYYWYNGLKALYLEEPHESPYYHYDTDTAANLNQDYLVETVKAAFACLCHFSGITQASNTTAAVSNNMINYNLSTLSSIARHEAEINNLAQRYTRKALSVASTVQMTANPDTITGIVAMTSAKTAVTLTKGATTWALPLGEYVRFICATEDTYFSLLEGTGSVVTSADGDYTLALASAPSWTDAELVKDWQDKIDLANEMIYNDIYLSLSAYTSQDQISTVIAELDNPQLLCIASDYKTLELIFMDLWGKVGNAEAIARKIDFYRAKYDEAYRTAFKSLDFGDYGYLFETAQGRVIR